MRILAFVFWLASMPVAAQPKNIVDELISSLKTDEISGVSPFQNPENEPLATIMKSKVISYNRTTYRSPNHAEESGYDVVHYEISTSSDKTIEIMGVADRETDISTLFLFDNSALKQNYLGGSLSTQKKISWEEAKKEIEDRTGVSQEVLKNHIGE